ncbi:FtsX-like permease family protein [Staphylococcus felis]|uniref:FtsX-like permease family protein n=1 Tax=Staphylococcus felis TaxID=46127 RepID=UPI0039672A0B
MSFNHIVLKNLSQNLRHYSIYLLSLIISVGMFFSFDTLKYSESVSKGTDTEMIVTAAGIGEKFLFVIIVIFLMYANRLFLKRRTRSFALFQLIGLTRRDIWRMLFLEQVAIFIATLCIGSLLGTLGSRFLLLILKQVLSLPVNVSFTFQPMSFWMTLILMIVALILIMYQSALFLRKHSIVQMLNVQHKSEATHSKVSKMEVVLGVLGITMMVAGYYLSTVMFNRGVVQLLFILIFVILFLTVLGAYFFFRSTVSIIFKTLKLSKDGRVNITDVIFTSSVMYRMKKNALSLTIIAIISAVTMSILAFATLTKASIENNTNALAPHEFTYYDDHVASQFEKKLTQKGIAFDKIRNELITVPELKRKHSDQNIESIKIVSDQGMPHESMNANQIKLVNVSQIELMYSKLKKGEDLEIGTKDMTKHVNVSDVSQEFNFSYEASYGMLVGIVNDDTYQALKSKIPNDSEHVNVQVGYELKNHNQLAEAQQINESLGKHQAQSRTELMHTQNQSANIFLFITSFLGVVFLIAAGCIIYIKQMDEIEDEIDHFRILRKLGYTDQDMTKGFVLKTTFNFGLPLLVGIGHAYFAARAFSTLTFTPTLNLVYIAIGIYSAIYFIFALIAYVHTKRTVKFRV